MHEMNTFRLFIGGLVEGLTEVKLKQLFPKCLEAVVKGADKAKAGKGFAFIQFDNPGDAKAAFDASKKLIITGKIIKIIFSLRKHTNAGFF